MWSWGVVGALFLLFYSPGCKEGKGGELVVCFFFCLLGGSRDKQDVNLGGKVQVWSYFFKFGPLNEWDPLFSSNDEFLECLRLLCLTFTKLLSDSCKKNECWIRCASTKFLLNYVYIFLYIFMCYLLLAI